MHDTERMSTRPASLPTSASTGTAAPPAALVEAARVLELPSPSERRHVLRNEAALLLDGLLVRVARGRSAIDVALCEGLGALSVGDRVLRLGYSGVGDYARERLGVAARTGQALARLGRALGERPLLLAAVRAGEVSLRAAQAVLPVASGATESAWVERARAMTVRALLAAVQGAVQAASSGADGKAPAGGGAGVVEVGVAADADAAASADGDEPGAEPWQRVTLEVTAGARDALERALDLAGQVLGEGAPRWQRLEAVAQEYLGAHGGDEADDEVVAATLAAWRGEGVERASRAAGRGDHPDLFEREPGWRERLEAFLEEETERWCHLEKVERVAAPPLDEAAHPARLDAALRELAALRACWDSLLGHLALLVRSIGLWRDMRFLTFAHYCRERLGLGVRQVEARIALERRLHGLPGLRAALDGGRLDGERARLVARVADERSEAGWIARAAEAPAVALRCEVEAVEAAPHTPWAVAARLCAPEEPVAEVRLRVPLRVAALLAAALRAAQRAPWPFAAARLRTDAECLTLVAAHFLEAWAGQPRARATPQRRALRRDGHRCQVPGCSRQAVHAHHVTFRSRGGGDVPENLVSLCAAHHLQGVHRAFVRVRGVAPHALRWELGERLEQGRLERPEGMPDTVAGPAGGPGAG